MWQSLLGFLDYVRNLICMVDVWKVFGCFGFFLVFGVFGLCENSDLYRLRSKRFLGFLGFFWFLGFLGFLDYVRTRICIVWDMKGFWVFWGFGVFWIIWEFWFVWFEVWKCRLGCFLVLGLCETSDCMVCETNVFFCLEFWCFGMMWELEFVVNKIFNSRGLVAKLYLF